MQKKIRSYLYSCAFVRVFRFLDAAKLDNICKNTNQIQFFIGRLSVQKSRYNILCVLKEHNMIDRLSSQAINQQRSHKRISFLRVKFFIRTK